MHIQKRESPTRAHGCMEQYTFVKFSMEKLIDFANVISANSYMKFIIRINTVIWNHKNFSNYWDKNGLRPGMDLWVGLVGLGPGPPLFGGPHKSVWVRFYIRQSILFRDCGEICSSSSTLQRRQKEH